MLDFLFGLVCLIALKEGSREEDPPARTTRKVRHQTQRDRVRGHRAGGLRAMRDEDRERERAGE